MSDTAVLEIRTYRLQPGSTAAFHQTFVERSLPLLREFGLDVVRFGPSECDDEGEHYVLIRSFGSLQDRDEQEERFYGSPAWRDGPRADVLGPIESYHTVVLTLSHKAIDALR